MFQQLRRTYLTSTVAVTFCSTTCDYSVAQQRRYNFASRYRVASLVVAMPHDFICDLCGADTFCRQIHLDAHRGTRRCVLNRASCAFTRGNPRDDAEHRAQLPQQGCYVRRILEGEPRIVGGNGSGGDDVVRLCAVRRRARRLAMHTDISSNNKSNTKQKCI